MRAEALEARWLLAGDLVADSANLPEFAALIDSGVPSSDVASAPASTAAATASASFTNIYEPSGNYIMRPVTGTISLPPVLLNDPGLAGVVLRDEWRNVNPAPGVYNWSRLDAAISAITAAGKQFKLEVYTGIATPEWVYAAGARSFLFTETGGFRPQGTFKMPVPWDEVMLSSYEELLREMDRHFGSKSNLVYVALAGPTQFSIEMHLPPETKLLPDYSPANIRSAWDRVLTTYSGLFPNVRGGLHLANPFHYTDGLAQQVAEDALAILGPRLTLQHNALSAKPDLPTYNIHQIIVQAAQLGVHTGFEELTSSDQARFGGTYATAWQRVLDAGARYVDFYAADGPYLQAFPNAAPSFVAGADLILLNNAAATRVTGWATRIAAGPRTESGQTVTFQVTGNTRPELFLSPPTIDPITGELSLAIVRGAVGVAEITVVLRDSGGTALGGIDTSAAQTFTIVIAPYLGDMNGDGVLDNFDIQAFELLLTTSDQSNPSLPVLADYALRGDINGDGQFNNFDIHAFEQLLTHFAQGQLAVNVPASAASAALAESLRPTADNTIAETVTSVAKPLQVVQEQVSSPPEAYPVADKATPVRRPAGRFRANFRLR